MSELKAHRFITTDELFTEANAGALYYDKSEADKVIDELEESLNRAKSREDVLVTDNRNLLEKVQVLENLVRDNSEHYKRNEAQILEASDKLKAEIERLSNALDKEHDETIKYMDELCNAKNEIERLTIDNRGIELRADIADATIEKLKAEIKRLKEYASEQTDKLNVEKENVIQLERCWKETKRFLWMARAERAKERQNYESGCRSDGWIRRENMWLEVERLCRHKAEEYKSERKKK